MNNLFVTHRRRLTVATCFLTLTSACTALRPTATPHPAFYALDNAGIAVKGEARTPLPRSGTLPTLIVNPPHATAGFDSRRIIYVRESHKLEYFAHSEWVDPPARMLAPLIVAGLENSGTFRAVILTPSAAAGDLRLDTEIVRLQHEFHAQPSRVRFTMRAYLIEDKTRRVLAWREFDTAVPAASESPYGGVVAANQAVQSVLEELAAFCAEATRNARLDK